MLTVHTPYSKLFRRTYDVDYDFTGVKTGQWVKVVAGEAQAIEDTDDLSTANLKLVISRVAGDGSIYEAHDTAPAGTISVIDGFGAELTVDSDGILVGAGTAAEGDVLIVGSTYNADPALSDLGKLIKVPATAGTYQVVAKCVKGAAADETKQVQLLSPYTVTVAP